MLRAVTVAITEDLIDELDRLAVRDLRGRKEQAAYLLEGAIRHAIDESLLEDAEAAVQAAIAQSLTPVEVGR